MSRVVVKPHIVMNFPDVPGGDESLLQETREDEAPHSPSKGDRGFNADSSSVCGPWATVRFFLAGRFSVVRRISADSNPAVCCMLLTKIIQTIIIS